MNFRYIDEQALRRFLKKIGHSPVKDELIAIMRRFDLDGDAKISFNEFVEALTPVQPDIVTNPVRYCPGRKTRAKSMNRNKINSDLSSSIVHNTIEEKD